MKYTRIGLTEFSYFQVCTRKFMMSCFKTNIIVLANILNLVSRYFNNWFNFNQFFIYFRKELWLANM